MGSFPTRDQHTNVGWLHTSVFETGVSHFIQCFNSKEKWLITYDVCHIFIPMTDFISVLFVNIITRSNYLYRTLSFHAIAATTLKPFPSSMQTAHSEFWGVCLAGEGSNWGVNGDHVLSLCRLVRFVFRSNC